MDAAEMSKIRLWQEITCRLCRTFFSHPVMLQCGHNFCKGCILKCLQDPHVSLSFCPKCKAVVQPGSLWPNPQLGTIVDLIRPLNEQAKKEAVNWGLCERHQEPLNFFCKFDGAPICAVCKGFMRHKDHPVVPAQTVAEENRAQIYTCLENLMKDKEEVLASKNNVEKESQDLIVMIATERQKMMAAFRRFKHFLEQAENCLLARMEEVGKELAKKREEDIARLSAELSSLEKAIREMEEECEKPPRELLKNIKGITRRHEQKERFETPAPFPPAIKWGIWEFWNVSPILETVIKRFKEVLESESQQNEENVTLNPATAHPQLLISEDRKCVSVSDQPERRPEGVLSFAHLRSVLGSKSFQSGRHCWEVDVGEEEGWAVGIAVANVQCNKDKPLGPEAGVWAIGKWEGQYRAVIHPHDPPLPLSKEPKKILVSLNYTGGQMAFFDAETAALLYYFSIPDSPAIPYYPFFWLRMNCKLSLVQ